MVTNFEEFLELYEEEIEYIFEEAEVSKKTRKKIIKLLKEELEGMTAINPLHILDIIEKISLNTKIKNKKIIPMKKKRMIEVINEDIESLSPLNYNFNDNEELESEEYTPKKRTLKPNH